MRINTNIASLTAQENASNVNKNLSASLEKLSSGLRINKASDDASGMAIADKLRTQASSLGQSISNANSANALVQIADKAMAEQSNILDIVKTKLIQAATETTSAEGRESIRKDVAKLLEQLDNIAAQTNYNGINLLDTSGKEFTFQVGEDATYDISLTTAYAANTEGLGTEAIGQQDIITINGATGSGSTANDIVEGEVFEITIDDQTVSYTVTNEDMLGDTTKASVTQDDIKANVAANIADLINSSDMGVTATANGGSVELVSVTAGDTFTSSVDSSGVAAYAVAASDNIMDVTDNAAVNGAAAVAQVVTVDATGMSSGDITVSIDGTDYTATFNSTLSQTLLDLKDLIDEADLGVTVAVSSPAMTITSDNLGTDFAYNISSNYDTVVTTAAADAVAESISWTLGGSAADFAEGETITVAALPLGAGTDSVSVISSGSLEETLTRLATAINTNLADAVAAGTANQQYTASVSEDGKTLVITNDIAGAQDSANTASVDLSSITLDEASTTAVATSTYSDGLTVETTDDAILGETLDGLKNLEEGELTSDVANSYMTVIDTALNQINTVRSDFGSTQNQLDSFIRNAMTTQTNIKAAESVIRDVDYAAESANFNKQNIVAQAGTYALSQANTIQQNVLRLLQ